jgi:hypothetical protein
VCWTLLQAGAMADHPIPDITVPVAAVSTAADKAPALGVDLQKEREKKNLSAETKAEKKEKKKEKKAINSVSFYRLFSFADPWDYMLMLVGTIGAFGNGISMPLMTIIFGDLTNAFGNSQSSQSDVVHVVSKVRTTLFFLLIVLCGISCCFQENLSLVPLTVSRISGRLIV